MDNFIVNENYSVGRLWTIRAIQSFMFADWIREGYINKIPMNAVNDKLVYIIGEFISPDLKIEIYRLTFHSMEYEDIVEGEVFKLTEVKREI